jgi:SAM-dependent methyltransferase
MKSRPLVLFGHRIRVRAWWRDLTLAFRTLMGDTAGDERLLHYLSNRADLAQGLSEFRTTMPQADVVDETVALKPNTNTHEWRRDFAARLSGKGLELGALHRPLLAHAGMAMTYVDRADQTTLKKTFPELAEAIIPVDIVDDAETLSTIADGSFDFVVAAHLIEHTRNPIGALESWLRVIRPGGLLYLIVPDKRQTFDRARVRTTLEHVILDYLHPSAERDLEHFLEYTVLVLKAEHEGAVEIARRLAAEDHSIHFHTFLPKDIVAIARWMDGHVTPVQVAEGPVMSPESDEFHLLLRRPGREKS